MFKLDQIREGVLNRFLIQIAGGTTLFKQNDKGNTLYILVEGSVKLVHKVGQVERIISTLGPGQIVGEKALCVTAPYRRAFTAVAEIDSVALEFDSTSLRGIAAKIPDFSLKLLQFAVERLDRANAMIALLQTPHPVERIGQYMLHYCENYSTNSGAGIEIQITAEMIATNTNTDIKLVNDCIKEWIGEKIIKPKERGFFVYNENALVQHAATMKEKLAA